AVAGGNRGAGGGSDSGSGSSGEAVLELVHESLVRTWGRFSRWLEESREDVAFVAEISQAAGLWERRGRRDEEVWQGDALREARNKVARLGAAVPVPELVVGFLAAGTKKERRAQRRRRVLLAGGTAALAGVAVVAILVAQLMFHQKQLAEKERTTAQAQRERAEQREAEAQAQRAEAYREGASAALRRGDILEARAKLRGSLETSDSTMARVLWGELEQEALVWSRKLGGWVSDVSFSPDGKTVAGACEDGKVYLVDAETAAVRVLRGRVGVIGSAAFSPDGRYLAAGSYRGPVVLWDLREGNVRELLGHSAQVWSVAFDPAGELLATASFDASVRLWEVSSGRERMVLRGHEKQATRLVFGSADVLLSAGKDGTVRRWDTRTGSGRVVVRADSQIYGLALDSAGEEVVTGSIDGTVRRWKLGTGEERMRLSGHRELVTATVLSPDRQVLASSSLDRRVLLWDPASGRHAVLGRHEGIGSAVAFSPDGRHVASSGFDSTVRLWQVGIEARIAEKSGHAGIVWSLDFSPDGTTIVSGAEDKTVRVWDVRSGQQRTLLGGHQGTVNGVAFCSDGKAVVSASHDRGIRVWDLVSGSSEELQPRHAIQAFDVAVSMDGRTIASVGADWRVRLWDARSFASSGELKANHGCLVLAERRVFLVSGPSIPTAAAGRTSTVSDSTDGAASGSIRELASEASAIAFQAGRILVASDENVLVLDENGNEQARVRIEQGASAVSLVDNGRLSAVGYDAGDIVLVSIDAGTAKPSFSFEETEPRAVERISEGPRQTLIVGYASGYLGIWSLRTGKRLRHFKLHGPVVHLLVDSESRRLYVATEVGDHRAIDLSPLYQDYCELLADIWSKVPVVWQEGMPALALPSPGHRCAASAIP
ncbi:MAG: hypothetical protein V2A73_08845, partial [Pseudomonadota bacterium]